MKTICGEVYQIQFSIIYDQLKIHTVQLQNDNRDLMQIMDRQVLKELHKELVSKYLKQSL